MVLEMFPGEEGVLDHMQGRDREDSSLDNHIFTGIIITTVVLQKRCGGYRNVGGIVPMTTFGFVRR